MTMARDRSLSGVVPMDGSPVILQTVSGAGGRSS